MKEREIRKYIDRQNKGITKESIFSRQINKNVEVAKVWPEQSRMSAGNVEDCFSFRFFFIKNELNEYIGAVLDMHNDLHWYITPKNRKRGYLTRALKESILPYLFYEDRDKLRITINYGAIGYKNYKNSKNVAINVGFKPIDEIETVFELNRDDFKWGLESLEEINSQINKERFEELRKRLVSTYRTLYKISDELLMAFDNDNDLNEVANEVRKHLWKIENLENEHK